MTNSQGRTLDLEGAAPGGAAKPIPRASLHHQLTARLRDMIIDGDLRPGERVPEKALCERFGVSRTPLRETLKVLASEDLLELLPNRGARVVRLTVADVDELFPIMGALEGLAGEFACTHVTDEEIAEVRALHYQMVLHYTRGELTEYFRLNQLASTTRSTTARSNTVTPGSTHLDGFTIASSSMSSTKNSSPNFWRNWYLGPGIFC